MALKRCRECGRDISTKAKTCPNCGAPVKRTGISLKFGCLTMIIATVSMIWIGERANESANSPEITQAPLNTPPRAPTSQAVAKVTPPAQKAAARDVSPGIKVGREYDIAKSAELRSGPGKDEPKLVNQKASDILKIVEYLSVDSSETVIVRDFKDGWAEVQVTQPSYLAFTRGWISAECIKAGPASDKLSGWVHHMCLVYAGKSTLSKSIGYLAPPSAIHVSDDKSGWLRLIDGPIQLENTHGFVDNPNFEIGLYIQADNFTTIDPGVGNK